MGGKHISDDLTSAPRAEHDPAWPPPPPDWRHDAPDPPDAFPVPWTWGDGLALVLWSVLAQFVVVVVVEGAGGAGGDTDLLVAAGASQILTLLGAIAYLRLRGVLSWRLLGPLRPRWRQVLGGIAAGVSGWIITVLMLLVALRLTRTEELPSQETLEHIVSGATAAFVLGVVLAVLLAPLVEELIYRAVFFQALRARLGVFPAMGISSLLWAAMHVEFILSSSGEFEVAGLVPMAVLAIFGLWLAAAFHRGGSLVVPLVGHAAFNGIQLGLVLLAPNVV
ncbi:MAG: lysostaphin resistance A-like protein [Nitriliruptorales bacterium]